VFFEAHVRRNLFYYSEMLRIVGLLESHDIPAIPLKGPALARWFTEIYPCASMEIWISSYKEKSNACDRGALRQWIFSGL